MSDTYLNKIGYLQTLPNCKFQLPGFERCFFQEHLNEKLGLTLYPKYLDPQGFGQFNALLTEPCSKIYCLFPHQGSKKILNTCPLMISDITV